MWAIRVLSGPFVGHIYNLKSGKNKLGRGESCDIRILDAGISKDHIEIQVLSDKIIITDLKSSNGTFVNGSQIQTGILNLGDKISAANTLMDLVKIPKSEEVKQNIHAAPIQFPISGTGVGKTTLTRTVTMPGSSRKNIKTENRTTNTTKNFTKNSEVRFQKKKFKSKSKFQMRFPPNQFDSTSNESQEYRLKNNIFSAADLSYHRGSFEKFIDDLFMPGIHAFVNLFGYKTALGVFIFGFVIITTVLTLLPVKQMTSESVYVESKRRALTLARTLALTNEMILKQGEISKFDIRSSQREEGVRDIYIVSALDGSIVAPPEKVGERPKEVAFVKNMLGQPKELSGEISDGVVGAAVPVIGFDPEKQVNIAKAHVVVIYESESMTMKEGRIFGLFIQLLALSTLVGLILFIMIYKSSEYPVVVMNKKMDEALKDRLSHIEVNLNYYDGIEKLQTNINSLLTRALNADAISQAPLAGGKSKEPEMNNLITLLGGYPALLLDKNFIVLKTNIAFENTTGISSVNITRQSIDFIPDQSLKENFKFILNRSQSNIFEIATDQAEINGRAYVTHCQGFTNSSGEIEYYVIALMQLSGSEGSAA